QAIHQPSHIPDGVQAATRSIAWRIVGIALHCWYVIRAHGAVEANFMITAHGLQHVGWPIIMKRLHEMSRSPAHIAEMDEVNLVAPSEIANGLRDICPHCGKISLTKRNAVVIARNHIDSTLERFDTSKNARNPS